MKLTDHINRYIQFSAVGLLGTGINELVLYLATERAGIYYLISGTIAFETALIHNFILNDNITFRDLRKNAASTTERFIRYNISNLGGLIVTLSLLWLLTEQYTIHYLISNLIAIGIGSIANYGLSRGWTWRAVDGVDVS